MVRIPRDVAYLVEVTSHRKSVLPPLLCSDPLMNGPVEGISNHRALIHKLSSKHLLLVALNLSQLALDLPLPRLIALAPYADCEVITCCQQFVIQELH